MKGCAPHVIPKACCLRVTSVVGPSPHNVVMFPESFGKQRLYGGRWKRGTGKGGTGKLGTLTVWKLYNFQRQKLQSRDQDSLRRHGSHVEGERTPGQGVCNFHRMVCFCWLWCILILRRLFNSLCVSNVYFFLYEFITAYKILPVLVCFRHRTTTSISVLQHWYHRRSIATGFAFSIPAL